MKCEECKERCRGRHDLENLNLREGDDPLYRCYAWMDEVIDRKNTFSIWELEQIEVAMEERVNRLRQTYPEHKNMQKRADGLEEILRKIKDQKREDLELYAKRKDEAVEKATKANV